MSLYLALAGPPNCGKSTLFNGLTGGHAKVANHSGVTVETRTGKLDLPDGQRVQITDLPGIHGLLPTSTDAQIACTILRGQGDEAAPDALIAVIDAANLRTHLQTVLQIKALGRPTILALNMIDLATRDGVKIDRERLQTLLDMPVVEVRATRRAGRESLIEAISQLAKPVSAQAQQDFALPEPDPKLYQQQARDIANQVIMADPPIHEMTRAFDRVALHPVAGPALFVLLLFSMFQAVFSWATAPMEAIESLMGGLANLVSAYIPAGWLQSLLSEGVIAGVGSVLVFLPQILILFSFILLLEGSGYLARASFLSDELMRRAGLNGQSVIPLLSAFACAIPGIMAARTMASERDRIVTIMIAPLMTCSARIPVYTLMVSAFIPPDRIGLFNLQGLVMFGLYMAGIVSAIGTAFICRHIDTAQDSRPRLLLLELPTYKWPQWRDFLIGLRLRAGAFLRRAGTLILGTSIGLWVLVSWPAGSHLRDSYAGKIGALIEPLLRPIGFNLEIAIALVPGLAAREVAIGALGTVYATGHLNGQTELSLAETLQQAWSLPTALAFISWYVFAPQCLATFATMQKETRSWKLTAFAFAYLLGLAWIMAGLVYHITARIML